MANPAGGDARLVTVVALQLFLRIILVGFALSSNLRQLQVVESTVRSEKEVILRSFHNKDP
jgi:hypothetical protein